MDYLELWKLLNLGIDLDFEKMVLTIRLGPLTIKNVKIGTVRELSKDEHAIERILSDHFIKRGVMWVDFSLERVEDCVGSLKDLEQRCLTQKDKFGISSKPSDKLLATALEAWANECRDANREFTQAIEFEKIGRQTEFDSEFILRAHDEIPKILGKFRKNSYPIVEMFMQLLDEKNVVKQQANEKLSYGKDLIVRNYGIPVSEITNPQYQFEEA
jgi:hypothetical protein